LAVAGLIFASGFGSAAAVAVSGFASCRAWSRPASAPRPGAFQAQTGIGGVVIA
jgi:hypothetical protein